MLILASTSAARRALLNAAGIPFRAVGSGVDERAIPVPAATADETPAEALAVTLALAKAKAVAAQFPGSWVLGADQVAYAAHAPEVVWGKPEDRADQCARLVALRGRPHRLASGIALIAPDGAVRVGCEHVTLWMRGDVTDAEIAAYAETGEGDGCAGGYAVEVRGGFLFDRVDGEWSNILGLPMISLVTWLREAGWRFRDGALVPR